MMKKGYVIAMLAAFNSVLAIAQTQPPNADFENWESQTPFNNLEGPAGWETSNKCTDLLNIAPVQKSTDAHSGAYSARLETRSVTGISANGVLTTAEIQCLGQGGGQQGGIDYIEEFPDSLVGWYKYAPANSDSAYIQVMFLANGDQDTVCFTRLDLFTQTDWTRFSVALCPDDVGSGERLSLFFSSSWGDGGQGEAEVGSVLFIDDIAFVNGEVSVDELESGDAWTVYPNPVQDELKVMMDAGQSAIIEIIDVTGKTVRRKELNASDRKINLNNLVSGLYLYQLRSNTNEVYRTGRLLVKP